MSNKSGHRFQREKALTFTSGPAPANAAMSAAIVLSAEACADDEACCANAVSARTKLTLGCSTAVPGARGALAELRSTSSKSGM